MYLWDWGIGQLGGAAAQVNMTFARVRPLPPLPQRDLSDKQIVVTGANKGSKVSKRPRSELTPLFEISGIGFHVALELARQKARVVLACRNPELAKAAAEKIRLETGNDKVEVMIVDFSTFESVKKFIQDWKNRPNNRIDVFINNAGACCDDDPASFELTPCHQSKGSLTDVKTTTVDGLEWTYQANFLSAFYCTLSLLDCFAPDARILQGSSISVYTAAALRPGNGNSEDLLAKHKEGTALAGFKTFQLYARSKAELAVFSSELSKRLAKSDKTKNIFVAAAHPGPSPCLRRSPGR